MSQLAKIVKKLEKYPGWVLDMAIGRTVPYVGTSGLHFEKMTSETVIVSAKNRKKIRNHIGQLHACAMLLLAETATGMVCGMNVPKDKLLLAKSLNSKFVKRSTGAMRAVATLTPEQIERIKTEDKGDVIVPVTITDEANVEPVVVEMVWAWVPKKRK